MSRETRSLPAMPLRPYPEYRDSGVEWLGDIPTHWAVAALRHRYSQVLGKMLDEKRITGKNQIPYLRNVDVQWDSINVRHLPTMDIPVAEYSRYTVKPGDLLVCEGGEVGRAAMWSGELAPCGFQKAIHRLRPLRPARDLPRFQYYALRAAAGSGAFGSDFVSTIQHLTGERLRAHRFPFPPLAEQRTVARFLDDVSHRVDRYIAGKEGLIELLEEQKRAIIHRAVTRGLDPGVPPKPSGISWLGDIPAHWTVVRLGRLFEQRKERGPVHLPILEVSLKTGVRVRKFSGSHRKQVMEDRTGYQRATRGDIAYNMMRMWQGAVGAVPEDGLVSPAYVVARPTPLVDPRYFSSLFRTAGYRRGVDMNSRGIVKDRNRLYWQDFKQLPAPCPPYPEQRSIVEYLDRETANINGAVEGARRQVELLEEYRKRLVANVVTGKLDIRQTPIHPKRSAQDGPDSTLLRSC